MVEIEKNNADVLKWFLYPGEYLATFRHAPLTDAHGYLKVDVENSCEQYIAIKQEVVSLNSNATYFLRRFVIYYSQFESGRVLLRCYEMNLNFACCVILIISSY